MRINWWRYQQIIDSHLYISNNFRGFDVFSGIVKLLSSDFMRFSLEIPRKKPYSIELSQSDINDDLYSIQNQYCLALVTLDPHFTPNLYFKSTNYFFPYSQPHNKSPFEDSLIFDKINVSFYFIGSNTEWT